MTMQDPIADMLTRIRNALKERKSSVRIPFSKIKFSIAKVLNNEGYINNISTNDNNNFKEIMIKLRYYHGRSVIHNIERVSSPGLRSYKKANNLPKILGGLGIAIISTSKGLMSDKKAYAMKIGGEIICYIS